mgnify:CR=1 FL=1
MTAARTTIVLEGELDLLRREELEEGVARAAAVDGDVVVDLSAVTFMDSSGVGAIAHIISAVRERGDNVTILVSARGVAQVLEICGIHQIAEVEAIG